MSTKIIECIYEGGLLRPLVKVDLKEGKKVKLIFGGTKRKMSGQVCRERIKLEKVSLKEILDLGGRSSQ